MHRPARDNWCITIACSRLRERLAFQGKGLFCVSLRRATPGTNAFMHGADIAEVRV